MPNHNPKSLLEKKSDYKNITFAMWLEKTNFVAIEEGDLNNLDPIILDELKSKANLADDVSKINLVEAINRTFSDTRRTLIRAIGMS